MATILDKIIAQKRLEVDEQKIQLPLAKLEKLPRTRKHYSLAESLQKTGASGIIAEFKRRSPSKNWINQFAQSTDIVPGYEQAGASGSSILTDQHFFGGNASDLTDAGKVIKIPILRKDFMIDEYQIVEAYKWGADVILLIAACLSPERVKQLASFAQSLGLEVLLEIHNQQELGHICNDVTFVGVNNRNLHTFETSLDTSVQLSKLIPETFVKISESGIKSADDIKFLREHGFKGFLIGESFMKTPDPPKALKQFIANL